MNRIILLLWCVLLASCTPKQKETSMSAYANDSLSNQLQLYSFENINGLKMTATNFGGRIVSLWVPDKDGNLGNVVLGYDSLKQYLSGNPYFGAMIGRYGNRIAKGKFSLEGKEYKLPINNGVNSLHGGPLGLHNRFWAPEPFQNNGADALELRYKSQDGEDGYPGLLDIKVVYTLTDANELVIDYEATTTQPTVINLTHHSFFNLAGEGTRDILDQELMIDADKYTPVDAGLIPTGELASVKGTPFDFLQPHKIGERIGQENEQLKFGKGYDHNWVLSKKANDFSLAATVKDPLSGRVMEVWTTEPGLQFYSGNFLDGSDKGIAGKPYGLRTGFCLEAQHFPDSPNQKDFPSTVLRPGEVYRQKTVYKFLVKN